MGYGIWDMGYGIWDMGYGIWDIHLTKIISVKTACPFHKRIAIV
ncbi:MAG: hypothetical protein LEGION0398_MBIBDBAK_01318 [Legionellaceae bacterium]